MKTALFFVGGAALGAGATYWWMRSRAGLPLFGEGRIPAELPASAGNSVGVHVRQIRRYAFAASQDRSPIIGITHASYALILLNTLEEIVGRDALLRTNVKVDKLRDFITRLQDLHAERLQKCDPLLVKILELERREGGQIPGFVVAGAPTGA